MTKDLADELERRLQLAKDHGPLSESREVYIPSSWLPELLASLTGEGEPVAQDAKDAEITRLRADITGLEDGNMTWMCDQLDKAKAENAAQAVELERMREAWGFLAPRHYLSLQAVEADVEGEPMQWAVYRESGGRSTRVSQAATPLDAAMLARQALKAG